MPCAVITSAGEEREHHETMPQATRETHLTAEEVQEYFEVGWLTRRALFDAQEIARMRACFDELERIAGGLTETMLHEGAYFVLDKAHGAHVIKRVVWAGACQRYLLTVGSDPRLTEPCAQLLHTRSIDHLLNQAHFKRPRDGVTFDWHQDIQHRDKGNGTWTDIDGHGSFVQTMVVIDAMTPDSGPMLFIPGSSRWGRIDLGDQGARNPCRRAPLGQFQKERAVTVSAQPGDTLFFGPYTVHASFENTSSRYRRVLINGYASPRANRRDYPGDGAGRRLPVPAQPSPTS